MTHFFIRFLGSLVLAAALIMPSVMPLLACDITIKPDRTSGSIGDTINLEIMVQLTHRNCPLPLDETEFATTSNLKITGQTAWVTIGRDTYKTILSVQLVAAGVGKFEIIRDCIKEGGYADITLTASNEGAATAGGLPSTSQPGSTTTPALITEQIISANDSENKEITWTEAFKTVLVQPFIWVHLGLVIFAYIALLRRQRRWRFISLAFSMVYLGFFLGLCPCAISAIQNVVLHVGEPKAYLAQFVILAIPVTSTLFLGRIYCGWICPMGAVQQFLYRRDLSLKLPAGLGDKLKWLRFAVLGAIIIAALYTGTAAFAQIDPFKSLFNAQISPVPTTLLVIILGLSIFIFTPGAVFCARWGRCYPSSADLPAARWYSKTNARTAMHAPSLFASIR